MRKKKESGETCEKPERSEESVRENNDSNDGGMDWATGVLALLGLAGWVITFIRQQLIVKKRQKKNERALLRQQLSDANADINKTNKALDNLKKITYERTGHIGFLRTVGRNERISVRSDRINGTSRRMGNLQIDLKKRLKNLY